MTRATDAAAAPHGGARALGPFAVLVVLTGAELWVAAGAPGDRATRVAALAGLVTAKVGVVLTWLMRAGQHRRAAALTIGAIGIAIGFAVVLMLEAAFRARIG